jgi:hypothetical protein
MRQGAYCTDRRGAGSDWIGLNRIALFYIAMQQRNIRLFLLTEEVLRILVFRKVNHVNYIE